MRYRQTRYEFNGTLQEIRQTLLDIQDSDRFAEKQNLLFRKWPWGCPVLWLGLVGVLIAASQGGGWLLISPAMVFVLRGAWMTIGGIVKLTMNKKLDLPNMRYEVPLELLDGIAVDLDASGTVKLMLDFSPSQSKQFVTGVELGKCKFRHHWLELSGSTGEGHRLKLAITRHGAFQSVRKTKRTVVKLSYRDDVTVLIRPPVNHVVGDWVFDLPKVERLQSASGQLAPAGARVKAKSQVSRNHCTDLCLRGLDLVTLLIGGFRALENPAKSSLRL